MLHSRCGFFSLSSGEETVHVHWFSTRIRIRTWLLWLGNAGHLTDWQTFSQLLSNYCKVPQCSDFYLFIYFLGATEGTWHSFISYDYLKKILVLLWFFTFLFIGRLSAINNFCYCCIPVWRRPPFLLVGSYWCLTAQHFTEFIIICKWKYQISIHRSKWRAWGLSFVPSTLVTFRFTPGFSSVFCYYSNGECMILKHFYR